MVRLMVDELTNNLYRGILLMNIYIDLPKAFHTLVHEILIIRLEHYGVKGEVIIFICSYLYQRQQLWSLMSDMR